VVTDLDLFERRVAYASQHSDDVALPILDGALDLVHGPVFHYRNADRASYVWVDLENWHTTAELRVTDVAEDIARRHLDHGNQHAAINAARRGLIASPTHSRLTRLLMEAHAAKGDLAAARRVFEDHVAALGQLELGDVDVDLLDYYGTLRPLRTTGT
jgi:hypothetical protein